MAKQLFAYYVTLHYGEGNEWLSNRVIQSAKKAWKASKKKPDCPKLRKACTEFAPFFIAKFDREKIVNSLAGLVSPVDEDGWSDIDNKSLIYGLRKSPFAPIDVDDYDYDEITNLNVIDLNFYRLDDEDNLDTTSEGNGFTVTLLALWKADVKKVIPSADALSAWEEKYDIEISDAFRLEIHDDITTYLDEDGCEFSSSSTSTLREGILICTTDTKESEFIQLAKGYASGSIIDESRGLSDFAKQVLGKINEGDIQGLMDVLADKDVNEPLMYADSTAPLPLLFSALFVGKEQLEEAIREGEPDFQFTFPESDVIIEMIYAITSMGGDLTYKIADTVSYLSIALGQSDELVDFLVSFGLSPMSGAEDSLLYAAELMKPDYIRRVIDLGADVNYETEAGTTALQLAAQANSNSGQRTRNEQTLQIEIISKLLEAGANINHIDHGGDTALSNAARVNAYEVCVFLLEHGALVNPQIKDDIALSPLTIASDGGYSKLVTFLESNGAKAAKPKSRLKKGKTTDIHPSENKDFNSLLASSSLTTKLNCPSCSKQFTVKTLRKWKGTCGTCYKKLNPLAKNNTTKSSQKAGRSKVSTTRSSSQMNLRETQSTIASFIELLGDIFELFKALTILALAILFIAALIGALI